MTVTWDVVVVGAGPAGVLVAERLADAGVKVLLLEAGPRLEPGAKAPEPDRRMWGFSTVGGSHDWYRTRAVGGRSLLWGGWCFRFSDAGFRRAGWPDGGAAVQRRYPAVEERLSVVSGQVDARYQRAATELGLSVVAKRGAQTGPATAWSAASARVARKARANHVVMHLERRGDSVSHVVVMDLMREKLRRVPARQVVLAASPVETARILLSSDLATPCDAIGRAFTDHMVASYVLLEPVPPPAREGRGPFPGCALLESFVNLDDSTRRGYPGGFSLELSGPVSLPSLDLERMVAGDEVERWSATQIHAMGELLPHPGRWVDLDPDKRDVLGRPLPRIHVGFTEEERTMAEEMKAACVAVADLLAVPGSRVIPFVGPLSSGAGHEAGTTRMGVGEDVPCEPSGRLRGLGGVWVADASVMPSSGDRHPTLTILAHALHVADGVREAWARRPPSP